MELSKPLDLDELIRGKSTTFDLNGENSSKIGDTKLITENEESIDVFTKDFSNSDAFESERANPFNLNEVADICEKLTDDGGVKKLIIKRGTGPIVPSTANVTYTFSAYIEFGEAPFQYTKRPQNTDIGMSTITGINIALASMRKGEKASFYFEPQYAYGKCGCPPLIPPNSTCLYIIELLDFDEMSGAGEYYDRTSSERRDADYEVIMSVVRAKIKEAKELFEKKNFFKASKMYDHIKALLKRFDPEGDEPAVNPEEWKQLMIRTCSNAAVCQLKNEDFDACLQMADVVLRYDPKHVKALYSKGKAFHKIGNYDLAISYLLKAKELNPKNRDINQELCYLDRYVGICQRKEKEFCQKMMDKNINEKDNDQSQIPVSAEFSDEFMEIFYQQLICLKESNDMSASMILSNQTFSMDQLYALESYAKSLEFKVYWTRSSHTPDYIKISKI